MEPTGSKPISPKLECSDTTRNSSSPVSPGKSDVSNAAPHRNTTACSQCGNLSYLRKRRASRDLVISHEEDSSPEAAAPELLKNIKFCQLCGLFFTSTELLNIHLQFHSIFSSSKPQEHPIFGKRLVVSAAVMTNGGLHYVPVGSHELVQDIETRQSQASVSRSSSVREEPLDLRTANEAFASSCNVGATEKFKEHLPPQIPLINFCRDCNIAFYNYENYVVHKTVYCQNRHKPESGMSTAHMKPISRDTPTQTSPLCLQASDKDERPVASVTPITSPVTRAYQCPFCHIRFISKSTLEAHEKFYCPENPSKVSLGLSGPSAGIEQPDVDVQLDCKQWISLSDPPGGDFKCLQCGYIGQTIRGIKMHSKMHAERLDSKLMSLPKPGGVHFTEAELSMIQHKMEPYRRRKTYRKTDSSLSHENDDFASPCGTGGDNDSYDMVGSVCNQSLVTCKLCREVFSQMETFLEHKLTTCSDPSENASMNPSFIRVKDEV